MNDAARHQHGQVNDVARRGVNDVLRLNSHSVRSQSQFDELLRRSWVSGSPSMFLPSLKGKGDLLNLGGNVESGLSHQ